MNQSKRSWESEEDFWEDEHRRRLRTDTSTFINIRLTLNSWEETQTWCRNQMWTDEEILNVFLLPSSSSSSSSSTMLCSHLNGRPSTCLCFRCEQLFTCGGSRWSWRAPAGRCWGNMWLPDWTGHDDASVVEPLNRQEAQRHHAVNTSSLLCNNIITTWVISVFSPDAPDDGVENKLHSVLEKKVICTLPQTHTDSPHVNYRQQDSWCLYLCVPASPSSSLHPDAVRMNLSAALQHDLKLLGPQFWLWGKVSC